MAARCGWLVCTCMCSLRISMLDRCHIYSQGRLRPRSRRNVLYSEQLQQTEQHGVNQIHVVELQKEVNTTTSS